MNLILFDSEDRNNLYPFTCTRAIADVRIGILTIKERWEMLSGEKAFVLTDVYLQSLYEKVPHGEALFIDASVLPSKELVENILSLKKDESLTDNNGLIAGKTEVNPNPSRENIEGLFKHHQLISTAKRLTAPWQIFQWNGDMLLFDFDLLTKGRASQSIDDTNKVIKVENVFVEEGASISHSILNAATGSIYIGKNATIMEGCIIRGPFAMNEGAVLKMGTKVYGATTLGPFCIGGGEIKNSVLMGYSNKAHDGYLGDSVLGEWCNLGAGTSVSNVKNTGSDVKIWSESMNSFVSAGNKCGVIMGDYSRVAINTSINTGTVIGVCANVFGKGLTPKFIPDFSWGFAGERYEFEKAMKDINNWKKMKNKSITQTEKVVLNYIFENQKKNQKVP